MATIDVLQSRVDDDEIEEPCTGLATVLIHMRNEIDYELNRIKQKLDDMAEEVRNCNAESTIDAVPQRLQHMEAEANLRKLNIEQHEVKVAVQGKLLETLLARINRLSETVNELKVSRNNQCEQINSLDKRISCIVNNFYIPTFFGRLRWLIRGN